MGSGNWSDIHCNWSKHPWFLRIQEWGKGFSVKLVANWFNSEWFEVVGKFSHLIP